MKFKTTKKAIMGGHSNVIKVGYCNLAYLLNGKNEIAYTTRSEGWGADIYSFGSTAIVTGYAPFGNIVPSHDIVSRYDNEARNVVQDYSIDYAMRQEQLSRMIERFITEVTKG